mgnify:CR=1 FL=1
MRRSIVARVVLVVLACLATASGALAQAEDRAGKTNKFTRKEIGQFFRDYPDMLKLVYKAMNLKRKAQGKKPRAARNDDIGLVCPIGCDFCSSLGGKEICSCVCPLCNEPDC